MSEELYNTVNKVWVVFGWAMSDIERWPNEEHIHLGVAHDKKTAKELIDRTMKSFVRTKSKETYLSYGSYEKENKITAHDDDLVIVAVEVPIQNYLLPKV
jgi:hypothetical protein